MSQPRAGRFRLRAIVTRRRATLAHMDLFKEHALTSRDLQIASGNVPIQRFSWQFRRWTLAEPKHTHGNKSYLDWRGSATFAEIALLSILKEHGFAGAVWRDNWREYRCFRDAMPPTKCNEPDAVREVCSRIRARLGIKDWSGCWDVLAWKESGVTFIECKKAKTSDHINPNQIRWLEAALKEGRTLEHFAICEWTVAP
jgi:hypothetical protein